MSNSSKSKSAQRLEHAGSILRAEAQGIDAMVPLLDEHFSKAIDLIVAAKSYVVVVGVGKSGHIGQKIAASFASTGTPSFFMHPTEASHGDLGMLVKGCVVLGISNSGESREMKDVLSFAKRNNVPVIGITRNPTSTLARFSEAILRLPETPEVCINGLAPTTSTTNTLAMGDALVVVTMAERGFSRDDFGLRHPGGKLGLQLQTVGDWLELHPHDIPVIAPDIEAAEVITTISEGQNGCVAVTDTKGDMIGMVTDGDLRRAMDENFFAKVASDMMTPSPVTLSKNMLMSEVIDLFSDDRLATAFIVENDKPVGVINIKSLLQEGYL